MRSTRLRRKTSVDCRSKQFRKKYGIVENVSDREYVSNGFHCHVTRGYHPGPETESGTPFLGTVQRWEDSVCALPDRLQQRSDPFLVRRAMKMGFYEGVNLSLSYCDDCGHEELNMDVCPVCGKQKPHKDRPYEWISELFPRQEAIRG